MSRLVVSAARYLVALVALAALAATVVGGESADLRVGWRGDGTGSFPDANPPTKWSASDNVRWKTAMPGRSNAAPIVVGDRVFTCTEPSTLVCVGANDGKVQWSDALTFFDGKPEDAEALALIAKWKNAASETEKAAVRKDMLRNDYFEMPPVMGEHFGFHFEYSMPTPTSDGKTVYVVYGTCMVAAYTLDGQRRWVRAMDKPSGTSGYAASPLLAGGRLIINMGGNVHGIDPATGATVWKMPHKECYGSPVRARIGDAEVVVLPKGTVFRASDGGKLADQASTNYYQSAIVHGDRVFSMRNDNFSDEDAAARMMATRLAPSGATKLWDTKEPSGYSSPLFLDGLLYVSVNKHGLVVIDADTGQKVYSKKFPGEIAENYPCIAHAGAYVFIPTQNGRTWVIKPGRDYQEVAVNQVCEAGDQMVGAPFFSGSRLYLRTHRFLVCIGAR